jgi:hypothetical protein
MSPAPTLEITGHIDGYALRLGGEVVATYPDWDAVAKAYGAAIASHAWLQSTLARRTA